MLLAGQDAPGLPPAGRDGRPSLEDGLLSAWLGPFGWLLLAEPAGDATLEELTGEVALAQLEAQRSDSPRARLAERLPPPGTRSCGRPRPPACGG